jgi:DNA modification methylase
LVVCGVVKITSPGGTILGPFAGSGTTLLAAALEGFSAVGCEVAEDIFEMARERLEGRS